MALTFKTEAEFQKFAAANPRMRLAASSGAAPLVSSGAAGRLHVVAAAVPRSTREPWRPRLHRAAAWIFLGLMALSDLGIWTCDVLAAFRGSW